MNEEHLRLCASDEWADGLRQCNPIEPDGLEARLSAAGFGHVQVSVNPYVIEFQARV